MCVCVFTNLPFAPPFILLFSLSLSIPSLPLSLVSATAPHFFAPFSRADEIRHHPRQRFLRVHAGDRTIRAATVVPAFDIILFRNNNVAAADEKKIVPGPSGPRKAVRGINTSPVFSNGFYKSV